MIRVGQIKVPVKHTKEQVKEKAMQIIHGRKEDVKEIIIRKKSIDARKKEEIKVVYTVDIELKNEKNYWKKLEKRPNISQVNPVKFAVKVTGEESLEHPPVIVGSGPGGLFCALELARLGYRPILLERGKQVEERTKDVTEFWQGGTLQKESNVQFGEGGAGTFSDGKLNTLIKDKDGRNAHVLEIFVEHGAKEDITYENKPHIGTDVLVDVVRSMREEIRSLGGTVRFSSCVTDVVLEEDKVKAVIINGEEELPCDVLVLALGHSARDTFAMLEKRRLPMEAKSFAVGLRVEHPQEMINEGQYGECAKELEAAPYKVTFQASNGRGVYSFCMCPGGYVVNASSEEGRIAVNGMSYSKRDGQNANSAIIVSVSKEDFKGEGPLAGVEFQRQLEENAYKIGKGKVPQQLFADYEANQVSKGYGAFESAIKGETSFGNLREIFPDAINQAFLEGMHGFSRYIKNFDRGDAILSGVESRTSSPVRMVRGEDCESALRGIYPCGEGAGYAGGITSAAMDGCKVAEAIARKFQP